MQGVIDERVALAYIFILSAVTRVCEATIGRRLPILVHGYDYPVPDGRGFLGGFWVLPGPWMEPGFRQKGYTDLRQRIRIARQLIDRLNEMLMRIAAMPAFPHVRHVDIRNTLSTDLANYQDWWANELHPTRLGFEAVTNKFVTILNQIPNTP